MQSDTTLLAATDSGPLLGAVTATGAALICWVFLIMGIRSGARGLLANTDRIAIMAFVTATMSMAAGGMWESVTSGIADVPASVISGGPWGNPGVGTVALVCGVLAWIPSWNKRLPAAVFALAAGVVATTAGGLWSITTDSVVMAISQITNAGADA